MGGIVLLRRVHADKHQSTLCDGRKRDPPLDLQPTLAIIVESVNWVTEDTLWDHEWITETKVTMKEIFNLKALHFNIDVPCPLQWALLWFSAPTNLNRKFVNNGTRVAKFRDTASSAIELTCNIDFDGAHTPRACFLRIFLCAPDRDCKLEEEMQGWSVEEDGLARLSAVRGGVCRAMNDKRSH